MFVSKKTTTRINDYP